MIPDLHELNGRQLLELARIVVAELPHEISGGHFGRCGRLARIAGLLGRSRVSHLRSELFQEAQTGRLLILRQQYCY